jgi:hypothetical protein
MAGLSLAVGSFSALGQRLANANGPNQSVRSPLGSNVFYQWFGPMTSRHRSLGQIGMGLGMAGGGQMPAPDMTADAAACFINLDGYGPA